jgi:hypothetical protein
MTGVDGQAAATAAMQREPWTSKVLGWGFHLLCLVFAVGLLWESSSPGTTATRYLLFALLALMAGIWSIWVVVGLVRQRRLRWWMAVAPVGGLLVAGLVMTNVPLQLRWAGSESAFTEALASPDFGRAGDENGYLSPPEQVGTFQIIGFSRDATGAQFEDASSFCGSSGFAYRPDRDPWIIGGKAATTWVDLGDAWFAFEVPC